MKQVINHSFILLLLSAFMGHSIAQDKKLQYDIIRKGSVIGTITFDQRNKDNKSFLVFRSDVKTTFIFSVTDHCDESAVFDCGIMRYSAYYQKHNGNTKIRETLQCGNQYKLTDNNASKLVTVEPIRFNMLSLYCTVPLNVTKVYSDNYQQLLDLEKVDDNRYRLILPDGNYNYYNYSEGVCCKVDIERTLFTLHFVLKNK